MRCPKCKSPDIVVEVRNANYSAFNGYRRAPSRYSQLRCLVCLTPWRSCAGGVDGVRSAKGDEVENAFEALSRRERTPQ